MGLWAAIAMLLFLAAACMLGGPPQSPVSSATGNVTARQAGAQSACKQVVYRHFAVELHSHATWKNCLDLEYLGVAGLPPEVPGHDGAQAPILPGPLMDLSGVETFRRLRYVSAYTFLDTLRQRGDRPLDFAPLSRLPELTHLDITVRECAGPRALDPVGRIAGLGALDFFEWTCAELSALSDLTQLERLRIVGRNIPDLNALSRLGKLWVLDVRGNRALTDISGFSGLRRLEDLNLWSTNVADVSALSCPAALRYAKLADTMVADISPPRGTRRLEVLRLKKFRVVELCALGACPALRVLDIGLTGIADISQLSARRGLEAVNPMGPGGVDLGPLIGSPKLQHIDIDPDRDDSTQPRRLREAGVTVEPPVVET